jgi:hypothetical protein
MAASIAAPARAGAPEPCEEFLSAAEFLPGLTLDSCRMLETKLTHEGRAYTRLDIGLSGTIDGVTVLAGPRTNYFTQFPEVVFQQVGNQTPQKRGVGRFEAEQGSALILLFPNDPADWNGRMWLTAHGAGASFRRGTLRPWDANLDPDAPLASFSKYERLMLEKGFAVAKTRRTTHKEDGDVTVTLEDGSTVLRNVTEQPRLVLGFGKVAESVLAARLGRTPTHTYWYGHSSGARPGRLLNYAPGANRDADGSPIIDGVLAGDSGAGLWVPILYRDGADVLFRTAAEREAFVKQIDLSHMLYVNHTGDDPPPWASRNYLANKRINAKALLDKGLSPKHRVYELHGVSHSGGEYWYTSRRRGDVQILDVARLMGSFIDLLDAWVTEGTEPPPSMSDWPELGDADRDGVVENPGIRLPDVACPLGLYFQYPPSRGDGGVGTTGFVPFDGEGLEPLDGRGVFVDMNLNRYRDARETVEQAWRRLGLLARGEPFSREKYTACVASAVEKLRARRLLSEEIAELYEQEAATAALPIR